MKPSKVSPDWQGLTAVVMGNGPSMFEQLKTVPSPRELPNVRFLVANGGYKLFPEAHSLMCSDRHWLKANPDLSGFKGKEIIVTRPEAIQIKDPRMVHIRRRYIEHVSGDIFANPNFLVEGHTSTATNISLAVLRGVKRIILLGIDLTPGPDMRRRTYDDSKDTAENAKRRYDKQVRHLTAQAKWVEKHGVEVLNCSPRSALDCYPYATWEALTWSNRSAS